MSQPNPDLFDQENCALLAAQAVYNMEAGEADTYRAALGELISGYDQLLRQTRRLVRRSDRQEFEMNQLNHRLADLANELEYRATHDSLSGALNRAAVIEHAQHFLARSDMAMIVLDIDHFKQVNDSFGHPVGDTIICGVVDCLQRTLQTPGEIGRVGGEEFTVILPQQNYLQAQQIAEHMRAAIAERDFALPDASRITASFGVSWMPAGADFGTAYSEADEAMYEAKRSGRNRVIRADQLLRA